MLSVRETAFECLLAITREHIPAPCDRHFAILCELAEISETLREFIRPRQR
jgi:hypothetical protein